jgi:membrane protein implicated in regulation of membrane protease activity
VEAWVIWLVLAALLAGGEIATTSFFLGPFAIGALLAMVVALAGGGTVVAGVVFIATSVLALTTLRPVARRHLKQGPTLRTGTAALVGRTATVIDAVDAGAGTVRLDGEVWTARPYDDDATFAAGERVHVMEIRGATALVAES